MCIVHMLKHLRKLVLQKAIVNIQISCNLMNLWGNTLRKISVMICISATAVWYPKQGGSKRESYPRMKRSECLGLPQSGHWCLWSPGHVRGRRRVVTPSNKLLTQTIPSQNPKPDCDQHPVRHPWHCVCSLVASAPKSIQCTPRGRKGVRIVDQSLSHSMKHKRL